MRQLLSLATILLILPAVAVAEPWAKIDTTAGTIIVELDKAKAPLTVENFVKYAKDGYFNGTVFHRIVPNFVLQGGGFDAEYKKKTAGLRPGIKNEGDNGLKNTKGTLSMARTRDPNSATSQFFINVNDNTNLDHPKPDGYGYAVFGRVVGGMDVVEAIRTTETITHPKVPMGKVVPKTPIVMTKVTIMDKKPNLAAPSK